MLNLRGAVSVMVCLEDDEGLTEDDLALALRRERGAGEGGASISIGSSSSRGVSSR